MTCWALLNAAGTCVGQLTVDGDRLPNFGEVGFARVIRTARQGDLSVEAVDPDTGAWSPRLEVLRDRALAALQVEYERRQAGLLTAGVAKSYAYAQKAAEVADYRAALTGLLQALTVPQQRTRFPFASADRDVRGGTLEQAIRRFEAGLANRADLARNEALVTAAREAVRAATSADAIRAAAVVEWETKQ